VLSGSGPLSLDGAIARGQFLTTEDGDRDRNPSESVARR
jgi:hypothetical protein